LTIELVRLVNGLDLGEKGRSQGGSKTCPELLAGWSCHAP
jgi:hypothetical protein